MSLRRAWRSRGSPAFCAIVIAAAFFWPDDTGAQPDPGPRDRKESLATLTRIAASFEVRLDDKRQAVRETEPAIRWTNTIGHTSDATLFFWMHDGRPVAVGTTFITGGTTVGQEFQSLALEPLEARRQGKTVWKPQSAGIEFRPIAQASRPGEDARTRRSQMKSLARRFRAQAIKGPPAYQENDVRELRLLAQPILQFQDPQREELEGAVFAFAMDTDVDVLLLIENRIRDARSGWEYAFARTNPFLLKAWCDQTLVWSREHIISPGDPAHPYVFVGPYPAVP